MRCRGTSAIAVGVPERRACVNAATKRLELRLSSQYSLLRFRSLLHRTPLLPLIIALLPFFDFLLKFILGLICNSTTLPVLADLSSLDETQRRPLCVVPSVIPCAMPVRAPYHFRLLFRRNPSAPYV